MHGSYSVVLFSLVTGSRRFDFGEPPDLEGRYPLLEDDFQGYYGQSPGHVSPPKQGTSLLNDLFPASGPTAAQIYEWRRDHGSPPEDFSLLESTAQQAAKEEAAKKRNTRRAEATTSGVNSDSIDADNIPFASSYVYPNSKSGHILSSLPTSILTLSELYFFSVYFFRRFSSGFRDLAAFTLEPVKL